MIVEEGYIDLSINEEYWLSGIVDDNILFDALSKLVEDINEVNFGFKYEDSKDEDDVGIDDGIKVSTEVDFTLDLIFKNDVWILFNIVDGIDWGDVDTINEFSVIGIEVGIGDNISDVNINVEYRLFCSKDCNWVFISDEFK